MKEKRQLNTGTMNVIVETRKPVNMSKWQKPLLQTMILFFYVCLQHSAYCTFIQNGILFAFKELVIKFSHKFKINELSFIY